VAWFDQNGTGELISRISGDTAVIKEGLGEKIGNAAQVRESIGQTKKKVSF
jgi:hypothetical protein